MNVFLDSEIVHIFALNLMNADIPVNESERSTSCP